MGMYYSCMGLIQRGSKQDGRGRVERKADSCFCKDARNTDMEYLYSLMDQL